MSKCDIKVLYTGKNRNGSHISKEVATKMADTLRGSPIVGYFRKDVNDFGDHGHRMILDVDGIREEVLTVPYGFVSTDAKVWFQMFEDTDEFGNSVEREYLMCEGYIWNGQFKEADKILKEGQPQSMEINGDTLEGHWANDSQSNREFFIITDAEFTKLCVLGDDVEPCFEGADIKAANNFSLVEESDDNNFKAQLLKMVEDLKFALEGGHDMDNETKVTPVPVEATVAENEVKTEMTEEAPTSEVEVQATETPAAEVFAEKKEASEFEDSGDDDDKDKKDDDDDDSGDDPEPTPTPEPDDEDGVSKKKKPKKENSLSEEDTPSIEQEYAELKSKFDALSAEYETLNKKCKDLTVFYDTEMNKQKDELINKFYMLSDEDKKDVLEHKSEYSLEDIEAKLSVICFRKKVNFNLAEEEKNDNTMIDNGTTFTLTMDAAVNALESDIPAWVKAIEDNKNKD